jgi:hypothetical protein
MPNIYCSEIVQDRNQARRLFEQRDREAKRRGSERSDAHDQLESIECTDQGFAKVFASAQRVVDEQEPTCAEFNDCDLFTSLEFLVSSRENKCRELAEVIALNEQQAKKQRAQDALDMTVTEMATKPEFVVPALSLAICRNTDHIASLHRDLAEEARIERVSGLQDLRTRRRTGELIVYMEIQIQTLRSLLRDVWKSQPRTCASLESALSCADDNKPCSEQDALLVKLQKQLSSQFER